MSFKDTYDFDQLVNEAGSLVIAELERQTSEYSGTICLCEECVLDMATIALNNVKPLYRVSLLGSIYAARAMDQEDYASEIRKAVMEAIKKVSANPSHD